MEQKNVILLKTASINGLYLGLISIFLSVVIWATNLIQSLSIWGSMVIGIFSFVISFVLVLIFSFAYRKKIMEGYISFKDAFLFGIIMVVVSTIISLLYTVVFNTLIDPDYTKNVMAVMQEKTISYMERMGAPQAQIDKTLEKFQDVPTLWDSLRSGLLGGLIGGTIISLITAAIVKKVPSDKIFD